MLNQLVAVGFLIGLVAMVFYTPMKYMRGIYTLQYSELTTQDKVLSLIPIVNMFKGESLYTGSVSKVGLATITLVASVIIRVVVVFTLPTVYVAQVITIVLFFIAILLFYAANVYAVFIVLNDAAIGSMSSRVIKSLLFPIGQYYIGTHMSVVVKNMEREETDREDE